MIDFVTGKLVQKKPTTVVVEANGLGYSVNISIQTFEKFTRHKFLEGHPE